jgi:hypothetical protein
MECYDDANIERLLSRALMHEARDPGFQQAGSDFPEDSLPESSALVPTFAARLGWLVRK